MKHRLVLASAATFALTVASSSGCTEEAGGELGMSRLEPFGAGAAAPGGAGSAPVAAAGGAGAAPAVATNPGAGGANGEGPAAVLAPAAAGAATASAPAASMAGASGSAAAAGAGGSAVTSAGAGGAPSPAADPAAFCPDAAESPSDGVACTVTCTDPCGIHNLGTRLCSCTGGVFDCASCAFAEMHPLLTPPGMPLPDCELPDDDQEDDESGCTDNERCQSVGRTLGGSDGVNRFCGCLMNEWDCDTKPAGF